LNIDYAYRQHPFIPELMCSFSRTTNRLSFFFVTPRSQRKRAKKKVIRYDNLWKKKVKISLKALFIYFSPHENNMSEKKRNTEEHMMYIWSALHHITYEVYIT